MEGRKITIEIIVVFHSINTNVENRAQGNNNVTGKRRDGEPVFLVCIKKAACYETDSHNFFWWFIG
ncbi:MAG: hypothetical protein WBP16_00905 [Ferruginibacter sp.]